MHKPCSSRLARDSGGSAKPFIDGADAIASKGPDVTLRVQEANRAFHAQVLEIARSQRLKSMLATLIDMPVITRSFFLYRPADLERSLQQHLDITYAIEQNDGELAQRAMQTHIRMAYLRFMARRSESPVRR